MVIATMEIQGGEYFLHCEAWQTFHLFLAMGTGSCTSGTRVNFSLQGTDMVIVHTHPPLGGFPWTRLLWYNDYWAGPRAEALFNDTCTFYLFNLLLDPVMMFQW